MNIKKAALIFWKKEQKKFPPVKKVNQVMQVKPTKENTIDETSKKSIHARLQEKKNEIAKKPGKDNLQRGVELA